MTRRLLLIFPTIGAFAACGPATTGTHATVKPVASAAPIVAPPSEHPARWLLHPSAPPPLHARVDLGTAGVLYAGDDGERWLDREGAPIASTSLLPESIVSVGRTAESFEFVSTTGTVFVVASSDPLGPAIATHAPPKKMRSASAGKKAILGVAESTLLRSTDAGATWTQVTLPSIAGTLRQVAMLPNGDGLLLFAPQRVMATTDDGATWTALATPGVGARRVVADANGDLMLEGFTASGILRKDPLRLEKIARAPASDPEMPMPSDVVAPRWASAIAADRAVLLGTKYFEVAPLPDDGVQRWSFGAGTITDAPKFHPASTFEGCVAVLLTGAQPAPTSTILEAGCVREPRPDTSPNATGVASKKVEGHWNTHFFRSDDEGKTWRPDGAVISFEGGAHHAWLAVDGTLIVDGACKWSKQEWSCEESPPVVRVPGGEGFAKVIGQPWTGFSDVVFGGKGRTYALGTVNRAGRIALYVSNDGGKDFARKPLPATSEKKDGSGDALVPEVLTGVWAASLTIDETNGAALAAVATSPTGRWVVYETRDDGTTFDARPVPFDVDQVQLAGRHGFAWSSASKSYETSDGGVSWVEADAPHARTPAMDLACDGYACMLGDFVTRVGWNDAPSSPSASIAETPKNKPKPLSPISCTPVGTWTSLGAIDMPMFGNADLGGPARFTLTKHDKDGSVAAIVGTRATAKSPDVVETKTISLFGPAPKDTATYSTMQLEGVAALRYAFKRDAPSTKKPKSGPSWWGAVKKDQDVDVEVAWYLASDGKVHRATIKGAGPLQIGDLWDARDKPSVANVGVLSIAMGGIHVRPFRTSKPDAPLYFITDAGKIETLGWPDMPTKDVRGRPLVFTPDKVDAARIGKRSLVFGYPPLTDPHPPGGIQLAMAWSSGTKATSWELRSWGLWPHEDDGIMRLRYVDTGGTPAFVVLFDGLDDDQSESWMLPLKGPEADPSAVVALPTAASLGDVPRACGKTDAANARFTLPARLDARHPLLVRGDVALTMAVRESVVHVSADGKDVCVSAFDAVPVGKKTMEGYTALLFLDDLEHAALFRGKPGDVSARAMKCTLDQGKPLPAEFEDIVGFGK